MRTLKPIEFITYVYSLSSYDYIIDDVKLKRMFKAHTNSKKIDEYIKGIKQHLYVKKLREEMIKKYDPNGWFLVERFLERKEQIKRVWYFETLEKLFNFLDKHKDWLAFGISSITKELLIAKDQNKKGLFKDVSEWFAGIKKNQFFSINNFYFSYSCAN